MNGVEDPRNGIYMGTINAYTSRGVVDVQMENANGDILTSQGNQYVIVNPNRNNEPVTTDNSQLTVENLFDDNVIEEIKENHAYSTSLYITLRTCLHMPLLRTSAFY